MKTASVLKAWLGDHRAWSVASVVLGAMLVCAAMLKAWELANPAMVGPAASGSRPAGMALVMFELGWGLWLLTGLHPRWTRWATLILFVFFFEVSLYQAATGREHCSCLGKVNASPWLMAVFDLGALLVLAGITPPQKGQSAGFALRAFAIAYSLVGVPTLLSMINYSPSGVVSDLRADRWLQERIRLDLRDPNTSSLVQYLSQKTAVNLTVDRPFDSSSAGLGRVFGSFPAWAVMEAVAQKQEIAARWDKVEDGYHLSVAAPLGSRLVPWVVSALLGALLLGVVGLQHFCGDRLPSRLRVFYCAIAGHSNGRSTVLPKRTDAG